MKDLIRTTDPALISFVESLLREDGIEAMVFDVNASIVEGSIGILPRRIVVPDDRLERARRLLADAGLADEIFRREW